MAFSETTFAERAHNAACAERAHDERAAALAVNAILTEAQAAALLLAMDALPQIAAVLAEDAFEAYGWPADALDECWLDRAGRATWAVFQRYRSAA